MTTALLLKIGAESSALRGELAKANGMVNQFTGQMTKMGGVLAGVFTAGAVASFVFEVSKLAAQAEGVNSAFSKIPNSTKLLMDMKAATEGTVDNLTLMQLGVQAFNNNAPLKELPEILNFIDRTADATNQDFKALADTIINNIGKESTKGLNELGLNIQKIKERGDEIGFVPALMEEINRKSAELGDVQSENADNLDRLNASWQNYKIFIGEAANSTGVLGQSVTALTGTLDILASRNLTFWEKLAGLVGGGQAIAAATFAREYTAQLKKIADEQQRNEFIVRQVDKAYVLYNKNLEEFAKHIAPDHANKTLLLAEFQKRLNAEAEHAASLIENEKNLTEKLNDKKEEALGLTGASRAAVNLEIKQLEEKIKKLRELGVVQQQQSNGLKLQIIPDLGSETNMTNDMAATAATQLRMNLEGIATSAEFAGGALIKLAETQTATTGTMVANNNLFKLSEEEKAMFSMAAAVSIGEAIGNVATGQESALQAVAKITAQMVDLFAKRAIAAAIANASVAGGPFPFASVILASAAAAAMKNLLGRVGVKSGGGGGAGGGGGSTARPGALTKVQYGNRVEVSGEFELRGDTAVALIRNQQRRDDRTLPTKR